MTARPDDLRAEALLYVQWMKGALGRFAAGELDGVLIGTTRLPGPKPEHPSAATERAVPNRELPNRESSNRDLNVGLQNRPTFGTSTERVDGSEVIGPINLLSDHTSDIPGYERLRESALVCTRCRLCESRTQVVFGEGTLRPRLMVIGEAPGAEEDASGRPFVGRAGQLLTRMLAAIGLAREDVYIANVLKCRPPENRPPAPDEILACRPFLQEQIERLRPELLLLLGNHATKAVLNTDRGITSLRGRVQPSPEGWRTLPTFHPAYLLRNPDAKRDAWADLQLAAATLGLAVPGRPVAGP